MFKWWSCLISMNFSEFWTLNFNQWECFCICNSVKQHFNFSFFIKISNTNRLLVHRMNTNVTLLQKIILYNIREWYSIFTIYWIFFSETITHCWEIIKAFSRLIKHFTQKWRPNIRPMQFFTKIKHVFLITNRIFLSLEISIYLK